MIKIVITKDDLDEKTIKVKDNKLTAPGAEIAVLDSYNLHDTDTHYVEKEDKYLKHVETGAVWPASIAVMKERAAPRNEELTPESEVGSFELLAGDVYLRYSPVSAISGERLNYVNEIVDVSGFTNAKEFNEAHKNKTYSYTNVEYFADNVDGRPKILATTFALPYPELPYNKGKAAVKLVAQSSDGSADLQFADSELESKQNKIEKTYHYKFVGVTGQEYEGTFKSTENSVRVKDCEPSLEWYQIARATYSVEPYNVEYFFGNVEVAPAAVTVENLVDHL